MIWKIIAAAMAALAAGCTPYATGAADHDQNAAAENRAASAPANPIQRRYDETMSGQRLVPPPPDFQLVVTRAEFQPGHVIPCHKHPHPRYVYLQQGSLRVRNHVTNRDYDFVAGDTAVESVDQWHQGLVTSDVPLILVAMEQVPRGRDNSIPCPAQ